MTYTNVQSQNTNVQWALVTVGSLRFFDLGLCCKKKLTVAQNKLIAATRNVGNEF